MLEISVVLLHTASQGEALNGHVLMISFFLGNLKKYIFFLLLGLKDISYNWCLILLSAKSLTAISDPTEFFLRVLPLTVLLEI